MPSPDGCTNPAITPQPPKKSRKDARVGAATPGCPAATTFIAAARNRTLIHEPSITRSDFRHDQSDGVVLFARVKSSNLIHDRGQHRRAGQLAMLSQSLDQVAPRIPRPPGRPSLQYALRISRSASPAQHQPQANSPRDRPQNPAPMLLEHPSKQTHNRRSEPEHEHR